MDVLNVFIRFILHGLTFQTLDGTSIYLTSHLLRHYAASRTMPREIERSGWRTAGYESVPNTPFQRCGIVRKLQSCFRKASSSSSGRKRLGASSRGLVFARACSFNARSASR